jgi:hypothetical protein
LAVLNTFVWEVVMVGRRRQLLELLEDERDPLARLVVADELPRTCEGSYGTSPARRTPPAIHGRRSARRWE